MYSKKVIDHFTNPRNIGELENPDGIGKMGNPTCLVPKTSILTNPGSKAIESVKTENKVLTKEGNFKTISKVFERDYSGKVLTVKNRLGETTLTPDHEIYAIKWRKTDHFRRLENRKKLKPAWYHVFELEREDIVLYPIIKEIEDKQQIAINIAKKKFDHRSTMIPETLEVTNDFLRLCGYYLAEGYVRLDPSKGELNFCFSSKEMDIVQDAKHLIKDIFGLDARIITEETKIRLYVYNVHVARFIYDLLGKGALNKQIPHWMLLLPADKQKGLINGLWKGDGFFNVDKPRAGYVTISKKLIEGLKILLLRQRIIPSIYVEEEKYTDGVNHQECYRMHIGHRESLDRLSRILEIPFSSKKLVKNDAWIDQDYLYIPITDIKASEYSGTVHNCEVDQNHSYVSENLTLHNCGDLMWVYIKVNPDTEIIEDVKVKTFGCAAAIATSSMITELAKGKHVDEAYELSRKDVADSLDGLPPIKMHCSNLSADALHRAIEDYRERKSLE